EFLGRGHLALKIDEHFERARIGIPIPFEFRHQPYHSSRQTKRANLSVKDKQACFLSCCCSSAAACPPRRLSSSPSPGRSPAERANGAGARRSQSRSHPSRRRIVSPPSC